MNKLQEIMEWYKLTIESQRVTLKILNSAPEVVPLDSSLAEYTLSEAKRILLKAENELNDLTVLSLVSVFEQSLLDHLKDLSKETIETKIDPELAYNRLNEFLGRLGK